MTRGASFHLKPMTRPGASHAHNTREWSADHPEPGYLLPEEHRRGAWRVIAEGDPREVHAAKLALASAKAKSLAATGNYAPVWEGVLNLPHPGEEHRDQGMYGDMVKHFARRYERITGHRVIAADVHLDEGRIENGHPVYNGHAHIAVDRTDEHGRPIQLNKTQLRQVQDLAATVTGLERGTDARETRRKHLPHQHYRALAKAGAVRSREEIGLAEELAAFDARDLHLAQLDANNAERARDAARAAADQARAAVSAAELYGELRGLMVASGQAKQVDYQEARQRREDRDWLADQVGTWSKRAEAAREAQEAARLAAEERVTVTEAALATERAKPPVVIQMPPDGLLVSPYIDKSDKAWDKPRDAARAYEDAYIDQRQQRSDLQKRWDEIAEPAIAALRAAMAEISRLKQSLADLRTVVIGLARAGKRPSVDFPWNDVEQVKAAADRAQATPQPGRTRDRDGRGR